MELLLPITLKLFPNMLPSTFEVQCVHRVSCFLARDSRCVTDVFQEGTRLQQAVASANGHGCVLAGDCKLVE